MKTDDEIRVVAVDDEPMVLEMLESRLRNSRYTIVDRALNGREAVALVRELQPDVVLMDIEMPVMDGIEATREISDRFPTPVVMLTAYPKADIVKAAGDAGAGAYLTKPASLSEIDRSIIIAMARFSDMQQLKTLNAELEESNRNLQKALEEIDTLNGLLPICSSCKKIRDDEGYWNQIESYIEKHSRASFSHGICPDCAEKMYGQEEWYKKRMNKKI